MKIAKIMTLATVVFLLTGCTDEVLFTSNEKVDGNYPITVSTKIEDFTIGTRALSNSSSGTGYDNLGLYLWYKGAEKKDFTMNPYKIQYVDSKWTYEGINNQSIQYFDATRHAYDFMAVIPENLKSTYNSNIETMKFEKVELFKANEGEDTPKEFLYSAGEIPRDKYNQPINLKMKHGNAKITFSFSCNPNANVQLIDLIPANTCCRGLEAMYFDKNKMHAKITRQTSMKDWTGPSGKHYDETEKSNNNGSLFGTIPEEDLTVINYGDVRQNSLREWMKINIQGEIPWHISDLNYTAENIRVRSITKISDNPPVYIIEYQDIDELGKTWTESLPGFILKSCNLSGEIDAEQWFTLEANAVLSVTENLTFTDRVLADYSTNAFYYDLPQNTVLTTTPIKSPTTYYTIPEDNENLGFTIKLSYIFEGTPVYDSRIYIKPEYCKWEAGKTYNYNIKIAGFGNGSTSPYSQDIDFYDFYMRTVYPGEIEVSFEDYEEGTNYNILVGAEGGEIE